MRYHGPPGLRPGDGNGRPGPRLFREGRHRPDRRRLGGRPGLVRRAQRLEYAGALSDPLAALLLAGNDHRTRWTIVNGRIVVENGALTGVDEPALAERANRISARLLRSSAG